MWSSRSVMPRRSPLRDGGYDISDFFSILPEYGDLADVVELVEECHRRGLRIIADLVMNHTSDQHPWFQESRQDRTNPKADWYVWSDDDTRYPDARIIFVDTERSNWHDILVWSKVVRLNGGADDRMLMVANLDPHAVHEDTITLDLEALDLTADAPIQAYDELTGATWIWFGASQYVRLDPAVQPGHVLHLTPLP